MFSGAVWDMEYRSLSVIGKVCEELRKRIIDGLFASGEIEKAGLWDAGGRREDYYFIIVHGCLLHAFFLNLLLPCLLQPLFLL